MKERDIESALMIGGEDGRGIARTILTPLERAVIAEKKKPPPAARETKVQIGPRAARREKGAHLDTDDARDRRQAYPKPAAAIHETLELRAQFHGASGFSVRIQITIPAVAGEIVIPDSFPKFAIGR
jgi:hypothetical protein